MIAFHLSQSVSIILLPVARGWKGFLVFLFFSREHLSLSFCAARRGCWTTHGDDPFEMNRVHCCQVASAGVVEREREAGNMKKTYASEPPTNRGRKALFNMGIPCIPVCEATSISFDFFFVDTFARVATPTLCSQPDCFLPEHSQYQDHVLAFEDIFRSMLPFVVY